MFKFEDKLNEIDSLLKTRKPRWEMDAIPSTGWEDVEQIIRIHLFNKFEKWDQSKPFSRWCARVIDNQIINIKKHLIGRFISPCQNCPFNLGDNLCAKTKSGKKCDECPKLAKWEKKKKNGYNLVLARSVDETFEGEDDPIIQPEGNLINLPEAIERLHRLMLETLTDKLRKFYQLKYIDGLNDSVIAFSFGFITSEEGRAPGYRQMYNMEAEIRKKVNLVMQTHDIF